MIFPVGVKPTDIDQSQRYPVGTRREYEGRWYRYLRATPPILRYIERLKNEDR